MFAADHISLGYRAHETAQWEGHFYFSLTRVGCPHRATAAATADSDSTSDSQEFRKTSDRLFAVFMSKVQHIVQNLRGCQPIGMSVLAGGGHQLRGALTARPPAEVWVALMAWLPESRPTSDASVCTERQRHTDSPGHMNSPSPNYFCSPGDGVVASTNRAPFKRKKPPL